MFSIEHLHVLRREELTQIAGYFPEGGEILELGAGTGAQARQLSQQGFHVSAVDLRQSDYSQHRVFPVVDYDGRHLPFEDRRFDVVFSSNVLEHMEDLSAIYDEIRRVLKPGGYCVHVLPSSSWRWWTFLSAFPEMGRQATPQLRLLRPRGFTRSEARRIASQSWRLLRTVATPFVPIPHGASGNALTELWTFSQRHWQRHFIKHGFNVEVTQTMGIFYTGYMFFGPKWDIAKRKRLAPLLGSACNMFVLRPVKRIEGFRGCDMGIAA